MNIKAPWLKNQTFDLTFILLPSFFAVALVAIFSSSLDQTESIPLWAWIVLVLGIDVSHVYSTLFRTYFNSNEFKENQTLLTLIPLCVWIFGIVLYSVDGLIFWRVLAYVAVFHFIRQQYGFLRLYAKDDESDKAGRALDAAIIYLATLYPIVYWHSHQPRNFHWFVDGDFIVGLPEVVSSVFMWIYVVVIVLYFFKEIKNTVQGKAFNVPKNIIVLGTMVSWYFGIVYFNGDMIFTLTNIVAHGIPYMALVWLYGERQKEKSDEPLILKKFQYKVFFSKFSVPLFFLVLLMFAYLEEGLWSGLIWREHLAVFGQLSWVPQITSKETLTWLVPLLAVPQATHYVLDGFIWKLKDPNVNWQRVLFGK